MAGGFGCACECEGHGAVRHRAVRILQSDRERTIADQVEAEPGDDVEDACAGSSRHARGRLDRLRQDLHRAWAHETGIATGWVLGWVAARAIVFECAGGWL